ncbi:CGNR zinc finger domain-containing protein [Streptomyces sp. DT24]|uniref:CGNR zinc finger domain-containing protein n=1 Tax=unclassified Streptomyces TaxID=2593676 RepID=UPI0023B8B9B5|nr:CGNR zinc finger domain-containing protein [Streptomyces sp. AM 4-1-1]WEH33696.1 CGNR zinc finger domain-containing protein [Streptomyces sp. AM 4-1-1]
MTAGLSSYDWRFDAGRPCLDLVATGVDTSGACERLDGPDRLAHWLVANQLLPVDRASDLVDDHWVVRFQELRMCVDRLMSAELAGHGADGALDRINVLAAGAPPVWRAERGKGGVLVRTLSAEPDCRSLLAAVARDAVELLTDPVARGGLRRCEGDNCRRLYLDTSRGRRRRWCSSEVCGNRERVARHRRRVAALSGAVPGAVGTGA